MDESDSSVARRFRPERRKNEFDRIPVKQWRPGGTVVKTNADKNKSTISFRMHADATCNSVHENKTQKSAGSANKFGKENV